VAKGDVPGEWYSPTQPFPTRPPAFDRQGVALDDLVDFTPEIKAEAVEFAAKYKIGPIFTPPVVSKWEGPRATLILPAATGGANWEGGSFDPETRIMYIFSVTAASALGLVPPDERRKSDMNYITGTAPDPSKPAPAPGPALGAGGESGNGLFVQGLPIIKPPYGRITALDMNKGELVWQVPHGETPDSIRPPGAQGRHHPTDRARRPHRDARPSLSSSPAKAGSSRCPTAGAMLRA
jgi:quinoprotein glucose dehydrogenase